MHEFSGLAACSCAAWSFAACVLRGRVWYERAQDEKKEPKKISGNATSQSTSRTKHNNNALGTGVLGCPAARGAQRARPSAALCRQLRELRRHRRRRSVVRVAYGKKTQTPSYNVRSRRSLAPRAAAAAAASLAAVQRRAAAARCRRGALVCYTNGAQSRSRRRRRRRSIACGGGA